MATMGSIGRKGRPARRAAARSFLAPCVALAAALALPPATSADPSPVKSVRVAPEPNECTAPDFSPAENACSLRGSVPCLGVDGADIEWEAVLRFGAEDWNVQFQAFSEEVNLECQYDIRVRGYYGGSGLDWVWFESKSPTTSFDLGVTRTDYPSLTLKLDSVKIWPLKSSCG